MSFVSKWGARMCTVPARVYFVAAVFALSTVYVSQEVGMASAQMAPPPGGDSGPMMGTPPGGSQPGGPMQGGPMGGQFGGPEGDRQMGPNNFGGPMGENKFGPQQGNQFGGPMQGGPMNGPMQGGPMGGQFGGSQMGGKQQNMGPMGPNQGPQQFGQPMGNSKMGPQQGKQFGGPMQGGPQGNDSFQQGPQGFGGESQRQMGPQMGGKQGMQGPMGMNEGRGQFNGEDSDEQESKMDAQRQAQMEKQFAQTKKQFSQMGKMLDMLAKRIAAVEKQGVKAPADLTEALSGARSALAVVLAAKTFEDDGVQDAMSTLQESGDTMREGMQKLEMLSQMPKIFKQAASEIKKLESLLAKTEKSAARLTIDVSGPLGEFRDAVAKIKTGYSTAQGLVASGDAEGAAETLKSDVWENLQDAYQYPSMIEALSNVKKYVATFDKFIAKASKNKAVIADSEASASLQEMRSLVTELKTLKVSDPEELHELVNQIFDLQSQVQGVLGAATQSGHQLQQGGNQSFDFSAFSQFGGSQGQR